ncbi:MAG: hypothetical protein M1814_000179 [Vezdaea aestivalis]|nr:MAG: hypothetical protein M1814_000179 [Vezdaea aestivalis]
MALGRTKNVNGDGPRSDSDTDFNDSPALPDKGITVVPPIAFSPVGPNIYRSGHPFKVNFQFLEKLQIRTIIYLAEEDYPPENIAWCATNDVMFYQYRLQHVRSPEPANDPVAMEAALKIIKDFCNHPILLHSNKGKHRVGVLIGCMRKVLQGWDWDTIEHEYNMFAGDKGELDLRFMEAFQPTDAALLNVSGWEKEMTSKSYPLNSEWLTSE